MKIIRYHIEQSTGLEDLKYEYDELSPARPSWIHILTKDFKATFITIQTDTNSSILYKRFTGNFYYPYDMSLEEELKFYENYAEYYDDFTMKNNLPMAELLLSKIVELKIPKTAKILDLGAGTGIFSQIAAQAGYNNLTLLDRSEPMLKVAAKKDLLAEKNYIIGDVINTTLPETYDVVASIMMFDAIGDEDMDTVLVKLVNHLSEHGYMFLIEDKERPQYENYFTKIDKGLFDIAKEKKFGKWYFVGQLR